MVRALTMPERRPQKSWKTSSGERASWTIVTEPQPPSILAFLHRQRRVRGNSAGRSGSRKRRASAPRLGFRRPGGGGRRRRRRRRKESGAAERRREIKSGSWRRKKRRRGSRVNFTEFFFSEYLKVGLGVGPGGHGDIVWVPFVRGLWKWKRRPSSWNGPQVSLALWARRLLGPYPNSRR